MKKQPSVRCHNGRVPPLPLSSTTDCWYVVHTPFHYGQLTGLLYITFILRHWGHSNGPRRRIVRGRHHGEDRSRENEPLSPLSRRLHALLLALCVVQVALVVGARLVLIAGHATTASSTLTACGTTTTRTFSPVLTNHRTCVPLCRHSRRVSRWLATATGGRGLRATTSLASATGAAGSYTRRGHALWCGSVRARVARRCHHRRVGRVRCRVSIATIGRWHGHHGIGRWSVPVPSRT